MLTVLLIYILNTEFMPIIRLQTKKENHLIITYTIYNLQRRKGA